MYFVQALLSFSIWLSPLLITYILWRKFYGELKSIKIFDVTSFYFGFGFIFERIYFVIANRGLVFDSAWSLLVNPNYKPAVIYDLTINNGFSYVLFTLGGIIGLTIYNLLNSKKKLEYKYIDSLTQIALPLYFIGNILPIIGWDYSNLKSYQLQIIFLIINFILLLLMMILYSYKKDFFLKYSGIYTGIVVLIVSTVTIITNSFEPDQNKVLFNLFDYEQIIAMFTGILGINLILNSINDKQEEVIRREINKQKINKGRIFALSFADRRRIVNPGNFQFRNIVKNKKTPTKK